MSIETFEEGQEVQGVLLDSESQIAVGSNGVEKIIVVMEYAQMGGVPWLAVYKNGKLSSKWNVAKIDGVWYD